MQKNTLLIVIAFLLGIQCPRACGQGLTEGKQTRTRNTAGKATPPNKATRLPLSPEAVAARRALYAESNRLIVEAQALLRSGDLPAAENAARQALQASPTLDGQKRPLYTLPLLLGDICLRQGKYEEALKYYLPAGQNSWRSGLNLDVALCYVRLNNVPMARRFYSDQSLLQYTSIKAGDLPGTNNPRALEASILLARGMEAFVSGQKLDALTNFTAAKKLAPRNGLIDYYTGMSLVHLNRTGEAAPFFQSAAENGRGKTAEMARAYTISSPTKP